MNNLPVTASATLALIKENERRFKKEIAMMEEELLQYCEDFLMTGFRSVPRHRALVRWEDVPTFKMYWYFFTHQNMRCPRFVVTRIIWTHPRVVLRGIKFATADWRGISGSTGT